MTALWTSLTARVGKVAAIAIAVLVAVTILYGLVTLKGCVDASRNTAQSKVDRGQGAAFQNSAVDAVNTIGTVNANQSASEDLTRRNTEEIAHAKGADARLDPDLDAAFVRAACRRASARNDPKCRLLNAGAAGVAARR